MFPVTHTTTYNDSILWMKLYTFISLANEKKEKLACFICSIPKAVILIINTKLATNKNSRLILVFSKELDKCEDLFLKEIYKNTYIAACKKANKKWNFYYVMPYENDITGLSSEVEDDITPPN